VQIPKCQSNLRGVELDFVLLEPPLGFKESVELTSTDEGHHEEEAEIRHEEVLHADQELMLALEHDVFFKFCVFNLVVFY